VITIDGADDGYVLWGNSTDSAQWPGPHRWHDLDRMPAGEPWAAPVGLSDAEFEEAVHRLGIVADRTADAAS
jgi:hypothetical protein